MKKFYRFSLVAAVLAMMAGSLAAQVSYGVRGAVNMFNMTLKDNNDKKLSTKMIPAWNAGLFAEFPLSPEFFIRPELSYAQKGFKNTELGTSTRTTLSYIELPVTFLYKGALTSGNVMIGFGPYIAYGIGGKMKDGTTRNVKFKKDISITEAATATPYFKPLDAGAKVYAGYELGNGLSFTIETSLGLVNIMPDLNGNKNGDAKNVGFGIGVAYKFR